MNRDLFCPDCGVSDSSGSDSSSGQQVGAKETARVNRRRFVRTMSVAAAGTLALPRGLTAAEDKPERKAESLAEKLYHSLTPAQKEEICFAWDYKDDRGVLRTHVSNNWQITDVKTQNVASDFFTADQRDMIEALFYSLYNPAFIDRLKIQLKDDAGGYGKQQTIALFGEPGSGKFEFVMTGRHLTIRCDGDTTEHVAFGGPVFYGHAARGFNEAADHPGNVYWPQALKANSLYQMLDGKQRQQALIAQAPAEAAAGFRAKAQRTGIAVSELSADQKKEVTSLLELLLEPYRMPDQAEVQKCLAAHGGLDQCQLSFYQSGDIGNDSVWDVWRLEGPAFVWHFRGSPHVHVWVNIADDPSVALNARG